MQLLWVLFFVCSAVTIRAQYDYGRVIGDSLFFYEVQRTGRLPSNNRVPWRSDSMLDDKGDNGLDLTGGYFDGK